MIKITSRNRTDDGRCNTLDRLLGMIQRVTRNHPVRVGVDGLSATGKMTLANDLAAAIKDQGRMAVRASLDDFKRPWSESHLYDRLSGEGYYRNAYDYDLIRRDLLEPLGPGGDREVRTRDIDPLTGERFSDSPCLTEQDAILIADGVFLFRPELNPYWDYRIFLEMDFDLVLRRGADRDQAWEPSWEDAAELYRTRYIPSEQLYIEEVDPGTVADVVLDMSEPFAPVWKKNDASGME